LVVAEYIRRSRFLARAEEVLLHEWLRGWAIPDLDTREEHLTAAYDAGLVDARIDDYTAVTRPSVLRLYRIARTARPIAAALYRAGLLTTIQHLNLLSSVLQGEAMLRKLWFYGVITAMKP
jgi:hypothetical protein